MTSSSPLTRQRSGHLATPFHLPNNITQKEVTSYLTHFPDVFWKLNKLYTTVNPKKEIGYFNAKTNCMHLYDTCPRHRDIKKILTNLQIHPKAEATTSSKAAKLNPESTAKSSHTPPKPVQLVDNPFPHNLFGTVDL